MVADGEKLIADGWALYEEALGEIGAGELPQMLRSIRKSLTPMMMKQEPKEEQKEGDGEGTSKEGGITMSVVGKGGSESPMTIAVKNEAGRVTGYKYGCPQCDEVKGSKRGMDSHIRQVHTLKAFVCCLCEFTTYNMDSLHRHEKVQHN